MEGQIYEHIFEARWVLLCLLSIKYFYARPHILGDIFSKVLSVKVILSACLGLFNTVEALVSGHPRDAKKVSVTGAGRLREWFSYAATRGVGDRWPLTGTCPANNKYRIVTGR